MILAAGRGERMRPLTDLVPKPLLLVRGKSLIEWHVERLAQAGFCDLVINHAHLGHKIEAALGNGERFGVSISYSPEADALETAGGIANALKFLGEEPFLVVNADIFTDINYASLAGKLTSRQLAWLVLVDNPLHHPSGDFALDHAKVQEEGEHKLTYSGVGVYRPELFASVAQGSKARLAPLLRSAMATGRVGGEYHCGMWTDVGTPQRLEELNQ